MKKLLIAIISLSLLTACGAKKEEPKEIPDNPLHRPERIEGLPVGTCNELFMEMRTTYAEALDDEVFKAASDILFSYDRPEEAVLCCDNIVDENLKTECKRLEE